MTATGCQTIKALEKLGFQVRHVVGSHHVLWKQGHPNVVTVPVHGKRTIAPGMLAALVIGAVSAVALLA